MAFAETFKALSDPVRRQILELLKKGPLSAGEIGSHFDMTGATISYHLKILKQADLIFESRELCSLMDIKLYVDTDADVRILRRITRDVRDRGRSLESVIDQYLHTVKPMHEQFVEPSKKNADIIIPQGGYNRVALEMVIQRVRAHLYGMGE